MITWNYRVFREPNGDYTVREVMYDAAGSILGCTEHPVEPFGTSLDELAAALQDFQAALERPVLTVADMPQVASRPKSRPARTYSGADVREQLGLGATKQSAKLTAQE